MTTSTGSVKPKAKPPLMKPQADDVGKGPAGMSLEDQLQASIDKANGVVPEGMDGKEYDEDGLEIAQEVGGVPLPEGLSNGALHWTQDATKAAVNYKNGTGGKALSKQQMTNSGKKAMAAVSTPEEKAKVNAYATALFDALMGPDPEPGPAAALPSQPEGKAPVAMGSPEYKALSMDEKIANNEALKAAGKGDELGQKAPGAAIPKFADQGAPEAGGMTQNVGGTDLAGMFPGDTFETNDGKQWQYHKPTSGGVFHVVKPLGGGKAKVFHGKMQPSKVGSGGSGDMTTSDQQGMEMAANVAAGKPAISPDPPAEPKYKPTAGGDALLSALKASVGQAKKGVKPKDMVPSSDPDPEVAAAQDSKAFAGKVEADKSASVKAAASSAALEAYKAAGGDDPAIIAALGGAAPAPAAPKPKAAPKPVASAPRVPPVEKTTDDNVGETSPVGADLAGSPGRGPTGKIRNMKAMSLSKLLITIEALEEFGGDPEALAAAKAAMAGK